MTLLFALSERANAQIETLVMPGDVIEGHAEVEAECSSCHEAFKRSKQRALCMDCHEDGDRSPPSDPTRPQVHNPEGGFFVVDHEDFLCIDCHTYIEDLEHDMLEGDPQVDCLECHDEVPEKE